MNYFSWETFYKYRFYVISLAIVFLSFAIIMSLWFAYASKANDVRLLSSLRSYSNGLEAYYEEHRSYPVATNIPLGKNVIISDGGFGKVSGKVYYKGSLESGAYYTGDGASYTISFRLAHTWSAQGLTGKKCTITSSFIIQCKK